MRTILLFVAAPFVWIAPAMASAAALWSTPGVAQERSLTAEDYYRLKTVESPKISPDGNWVAYTVSTPVEETNGSDTEVWVTSTRDGATPRRVDPSGGNLSQPEWTTTGLLRVTRDDDTRWRVDPTRPVSVVQDDDASPAGILSPDGRWLLEAREVPRPVTPAPPMTDFERRHQDRFEGEDFDWYPFRRDGQAFPLPDGQQRAAIELFLRPADEPASAATQITRLGLRVGDATWSPDGSSVVFIADESILDELDYPRTDIFRVSVEGRVTRLTNDAFQYSNVAISPDGRWISYIRSFGTDMIREQVLDHGGPRDVYLRPAQGGESINLTREWDLDPGSPQWSPDGRHLYMTAGIGGAVHLFQISVAGGVAQVTTGERRILNLDISADFSRMTYRVGQFDRPSDVYVANIDGTDERRLTHVNDEFLEGVALASRPAETIHYESYDGTPVEGFLIYPFAYDPSAAPYPLIVVNHGGPHSASGYNFNFKNQLFAANGYFVFLPNFRGSTGYGDAFKWGIWGAWGTNDGEDVMAGVDHLIDRFGIDRNRVGSTGHSYGGILTNWLITRYPDRFVAAVSGAGASNWTSNYALSDVARTKELEFYGRPWEPRAREIMIRQSAYLNSGGVRAATLFVHGEEDYRVPLEGAIQLYTSLKKQRVPTRLIIYEGMAHGIRGHWNGVHRMLNELGWWEQYLKPTARARAEISP